MTKTVPTISKDLFRDYSSTICKSGMHVCANVLYASSNVANLMHGIPNSPKQRHLPLQATFPVVRHGRIIPPENNTDPNNENQYNMKLSGKSSSYMRNYQTKITNKQLEQLFQKTISYNQKQVSKHLGF